MAQLTESGLTKLVDNINKNINTKVNAVKENLANNVSYVKTISEWTEEDGKFKKSLKHPLKTKRVVVSAVDSLGESIFLPYRVVDESTVDIELDVNEEVTVIIINGESEIQSIDINMDDNSVSATSTWSSQKVKSEIDVIKSEVNVANGEINKVKESIIEQGVEIQSLKQSVSDGKNIIATAITDKGVIASSNDSFVALGNKISSIKTSVELSVEPSTTDYLLYNNNLSMTVATGNVMTYKFFYTNLFYNGSIELLIKASKYHENYYDSPLKVEVVDASGVIIYTKTIDVTNWNGSETFRFPISNITIGSVMSLYLINDISYGWKGYSISEISILGKIKE